MLKERNRTNWKLIFKLSLLVCFISSLIVMVFSLFTILGNINPSNFLNWLFYIILILGTLMPPVLVIARKVSDDRFLHGFLVGCVSGLIGIPFLMLLIMILVAITNDPGGAYAALLVFVVPFVGVIIGCAIGWLSKIVGKRYDQKLFDKSMLMQSSSIDSENEHR